MRLAASLLVVLAAAASCGRGPDDRIVSRQAASAKAPDRASAVPATQVQAGQFPPAPAVAIAADPLGTAYTTADGPCRLTWIVSYDGLNRGVVMHRPDCAASLSALAPLAGRILDAVAADPFHVEALRTLHWGRILPDGETDNTLARRLALAAWQSDGWDPRTGRPRSGDVNGFVLGLARSARVCREFQEAFEARGLRLEPSAVEKVLVSRMDDLPFSGALAAAGLPAGTLVPWDAQLWCSIRPLGAR